MNEIISADAIINNANRTSTFSAATDARPVAVKALYGAFNNREQRILSVEEAIKEAKCDYQVEKQSLLRLTPDMLECIKNGLPLEGVSLRDIVTSHCATSRTDNNIGLGVVGKDYGVVQNEKAFEFINFIKEVSGEQPIIETAGALGYGERMYVTCKLGKDIFLGDNGNDPVEQYVVFTNTHDGSGAVQVFFTPIRVVCQNTLNMALQGAKNKLSFKHTKYVNNRLNWEIEENRKKALEVFERSVKFSETFKEAMMNFKSQSVSAEFVKDFATRMYVNEKDFNLYLKADRNLDRVAEISTKAKNKIEKLQNSIDFGVGQNLYRGTKLWLLNGLTTMLHNDTAWKSSEDEFKSLMEGDGAKKVQLAYDLLSV